MTSSWHWFHKGVMASKTIVPWIVCITLTRLFWANTKETSKLHMSGLLCGESTGVRWVPLHWDCDNFQITHTRCAPGWRPFYITYDNHQAHRVCEVQLQIWMKISQCHQYDKVECLLKPIRNVSGGFRAQMERGGGGGLNHNVINPHIAFSTMFVELHQPN